MFEALKAWDEGAFVIVNQHWAATWLDPIMGWVSNKYAWIPIYFLIGYAFSRKFGRQILIPFVLTLVAFGLTDSISTQLIKKQVKRERPFYQADLHARRPDQPKKSYDDVPKEKREYGFVSSHATNMFGLATMLILLLKWRWKQAILPLFLASLVAYSRVYLGVHYPLDVIVGALLGLVISLLVYHLARRIPSIGVHLR